MTINWRDSLKTLQLQFEALAARSAGLHHLFVEVPDDERNKMFGPKWIGSLDKELKIVDGKPVYEQWDCCKFHGLPLINPGFREPKPDETFDESRPVIRDGSGVVRAVPVPMRLRQAFYCGRPYDVATAYESLANAAATAMAGASDLNEHFFASDLTDIFRKPRGGVRYVFGDVPAAPKQFFSHGWDAGVLQFENGVLIDVPISESMPNSDHWVLLLHRLGWRRIEGSGLRAERRAWEDNVDVALELLETGSLQDSSGLSKLYSQVSKNSFYSVIGTREVPLDVSLASVFAIQMLLADLTPTIASVPTATGIPTDYSKEDWKRLPSPSARGVSEHEAKSVCSPVVGIVVATDVERQAVLKKLRPPKNKRAVLQVHVGANTYFLGRLGTADTVLCMSSMGSVGRDASTLVTTDLIDTWTPSAVIMVGIAFGKDSTKQQIGNVLVSERIISYETQRIGTIESHDRGSQPSSGAVLLNRFRNVFGWNFKRPDGELCGFQVGPILSGEKLVDNLDFKRDLFERFPTAIGGEMEGAGVASAADRKRCEWIVVKAICDWGDGTKSSSHQEFAAASAVHLVEHVLNQPGALDSLLK